jgi:signal transduction histidine kinase
MNALLSDYYFTGGEVLVLLILAGLSGIAVLWALWRRWHNRLGAMEQELADTRTRYDREYFRVLHDHLQSAISHEVVKGLDFISKKSEETLKGLGEEQAVLRGKQHWIAAKASEMAQHAGNMMYLFSPEPDTLPKEFLNIRRFTEHVLLELYPYAESRGVTLVPVLDDLEPIALNRDAVLLALRNVIHNAIRYSQEGRVVDIALCLRAAEEGTGDEINVDVKDSGIGIREEDQERIFELSKRADGLVEPGSGLGLYLAREAARSQGGDLILVSSSLNQGSVFRIIFRYGSGDLGE